MDFIGKRKFWYILSLLVLIPGLISLMLQGLNLGIDFAGGTIAQVKFQQEVRIEDLRAELTNQGYGSSKIQEMDDGSYQIKTTYLEQEQQNQLVEGLQTSLGELELLRSEAVGATIGKELVQSGLLALGIAILLMIAYIAYRFELKFAIAGIIALFHDILIVVSVFSIFQLEVDSTFIAAVLTIFGYSINDKIVIFDRIRENLHKVKKAELLGVVNTSIKQSLTRSINTSVSTLILLVALFLFGGQTTKIFVLSLIIGIAVGAYSSIFFASPLWYDMTMRGKDKQLSRR